MKSTHAAVLATLVTATILGGCFGASRPFLLRGSDGMACMTCKTTITQVRFAAQIIGAGDETLFFDDLACLAAFLSDSRAVSKDAQVYVADYHTGDWIEAHRAVYARDLSVATPKGSHLLAFRDLQSATISATAARTMVSTVEAIGERWVMSSIVY